MKKPKKSKEIKAPEKLDIPEVAKSEDLGQSSEVDAIFKPLPIPEGCMQAEIPEAIRRKWLPRPKISSVDWFEQNISIPKRLSAYPGFYNRNNFPYQVGVLQAFDDIEVREIYLQWATQLGKTTITSSLPAKIAMTDPSPMMFVAADESQADEISREKIMATAETIPELARRLLPKPRRDVKRPDFGDCMTYMAWSGSPTTMGGRPCRYVFGTELSKWSQEKSREARATDLVRERIKGFWDTKIIFEGTPTIVGVCEMERLETGSNQKLKYWVPCPHCGKMLYLHFSQLKWEKTGAKSDRDLAYQTAWYECEYCRGRIEDGDKRSMIRLGVWAETAELAATGQPMQIVFTPGKSKQRLHLQLASFYSPVVTLGQMASEFLRSELDNALQNFINSWLAETFEINKRQYQWEQLRKKIGEPYELKTVPAWSRLMTAGVDIHPGQAYYVIRAWGAGGRSRCVAYGVIGSVVELEGLIFNTIYRGESGNNQRVVLAGVDSGWDTANVYSWCGMMQEKYGDSIRPIKGQKTGAPWYSTTMTRSGVDGKRVENGGIVLWNINDPYWKSMVVEKFKSRTDSPGRWTIPDNAEEYYVRGISGEIPQEKKDSKGRTFIDWVVVDSQYGNHFLDAEKIAAAMAGMCGLERLQNMAFQKQPEPVRRPEPQPEERKQASIFNHDQDGGWLSGGENFLG